MTSAAALDALERGTDAMVADLARLVAVDTSFPPGAGYGAFADLAESLAAPLGFACERVTVPEALWRPEEESLWRPPEDSGDGDAPGDAHGERVNVIARRPGATAPALGIYFHVDTVPPGDGWRRPPLTLTHEGDRLYGRGTADMKGTIASTLAALRAADAVGMPLRFAPELLFCTDEEGGLHPGIRHLAETGRLSGHLLCLNGGAVPRRWAGCFGSMDLAVTFFGRPAHSGDPGAGVNAVEAALPVLAALMELKARVEARVSAMPPPPHLEGRPLTGRLTVTAAAGGAKGSALPGRFRIVINRRYAPEENAEDVRAEIEETIGRAVAGTPLFGHRVALVGHLAPVVDPDGPHWPRWQAALAAGFGWDPAAFRRYGASSSSDMGWVQRAGISEILLGGLARPDRNVHGADEHTTLADLTGLARAILLYLAPDFAADVPPGSAVGTGGATTKPATGGHR